MNPEVENKIKEKKENEVWEKDVTQVANKDSKSYLETDPTLIDFYNKYNKYAVTEDDKKTYQEFIDGLTPQEKKILNSNRNYYEVHFENIGGLVMPIILEFTFEDGTKETQRIPAEIWKKDNYNISKVFVSEKKITSIQLDPNLETADTDVNNNAWPRKMEPTRFELYRETYGYGKSENPMKKAKK